MNISEMKYGEVIGLVKSLQDAGLVGAGAPVKQEENAYYKVGETIFIRTVTHILIGKLVAVYHNELVIEDASWIADTGRYANALLDFKNLNEVEPYPDGIQVIVGRGAIIDAHMTTQKPPRVQK